jgi:hypothetical protein
MLDLAAALNPPYESSYVATVERTALSPLQAALDAAGFDPAGVSRFVLTLPGLQGEAETGLPPVRLRTQVEASDSLEGLPEDRKHHADPDVTRSDPQPALPVLPTRAKAWLVTYLDGSRDLLVTHGEEVEDSLAFFAEDEIRRIWSMQRIQGGMLRVADGAAGRYETVAEDGRWMARGGGSSLRSPVLYGKSPDSDSAGMLLVKRSFPMAGLGAWQIRWPNGEVWIYVCSIGMTGPDLAAALDRQVPGDFDFAVQRVDRGRLPLNDLPVPGGWTLLVERSG